MRVVTRLALCAVGTVIFASCAGDRIIGPEYPPPSPAVRAFVHSQGLPLLQALERRFEDEDIEVFRVAYGRPHDCISGCFYSSAYGLRSAGRIGWIAFEDADGYEPDNTRFFDVTPADSALCRPALWDRMQASEASPWWFWNALLPVVAGDADTDPRALRRISTMLYSYISPHVAWQLLKNAFVRQDVVILTTLASLPVFQGDAYELPRARAKELLEGLGADDPTVKP